MQFCNLDLQCVYNVAYNVHLIIFILFAECWKKITSQDKFCKMSYTTFIIIWWTELTQEISANVLLLVASACTPLNGVFGWLTWGMNGLVTYRTLPMPQLSARSCWSHTLGGRPHLGSSLSLFCRPTLEDLVVKHTELWTCVFFLLVKIVESINAMEKHVM